jgi:tRNA-2-methylthio-N6-dimethylallyladenosine synthase
MTDRAVDAIADCAKVCPHVHLPLQSGSDAVLERMRRTYTMAYYEALVEKLRSAVPGLALTTDIIVGFPGETDADYEMTRDAMRRIRYDSAFIFKYSPRPGARSAEWPETVSEEEKTRRITLLIQEQKQTSLELNETAVGAEVQVLVEGQARKDGQWFGKTPHFKTVAFPHGVERVGDTIRVRIAEASPYTLFGEGVPAAARSLEDATV